MNQDSNLDDCHNENKQISKKVFALVIFFIHEILKIDQKMVRAKKVVTMKSPFSHIHQLREGIL